MLAANENIAICESDTLDVHQELSSDKAFWEVVTSFEERAQVEHGPGIYGQLLEWGLQFFCYEENLLDLLAPSDKASHVKEHMEFTSAIYDYFGRFVADTEAREEIAVSTLRFARIWGRRHFGTDGIEPPNVRGLN